MPENMFHYIVSYKQTFVLMLYTILFLEVHAVEDICNICSCYIPVTLVNCGNRGLLSIPQPIPTTVEQLDLSENEITAIPQGSFQNHSRLQTIDLRYNQITTIIKESFQNLPRLQTIDLGDNEIRTIPQGSFQNLQSLVEIHLGVNEITTIQQGSFQNLSSLQTIYLHKNKITTISQGAFQNIPRLGKIELGNNIITTIPQGSFQNLQSLKEIYLYNNKITTIQQGSFQNCPSLHTLYLNNNKITTIPQGSFQNLQSLVEIKLENNQIQKYEDGAFLFLPSIKTINLENNKNMTCGCHLPAFVNHIKKVYHRSVTVRGKCQEATGVQIPILNYAQCKDYSLFQRNLQCQTCSKMTCNESSVTSCPGAEPVCRFAMSMNGVTMKIEKSCSTYRKCVEAMRNNTLTCNKWTNGTSCVGCCVGNLCNKNDFLDWTNFFVFHLTFKKFSEYKISAENLSKAMERELTTTGTFTIEYCGLDRNRTIFAIYSKPYSKTSKKQLLRNISQVLNTSQTLRNVSVQQSHIELFDEMVCDESTTSTNNRAFSWPMTKIGTTAEIPCHGNVATRHCSSRTMGHPEMASSQNLSSQKCSPFTGIWQEPDMSQCYNAEQSKGIDDGFTKSFVFRLILKTLNEYKIPAENISKVMEHEFSTMTGNFRVENSGSNRIKIFAIYCTVFSEMTESQLRRNISQVLNKSQALLNIGVQKLHLKLLDERNIDSILEEVLDVSQKSVYFKEDVELAVDLHEKMVPLVSKVSANITLNHTLRSINNLLNIPEEVLAETEQENRSANRLLHLIQEIPEKIPLEEQQVTAIYSNLGIGVAKVNPDAFDGLFYGVSYGTNEPRRKTMIYDSPNPDQQEADAKIMASISLPRSLLKHLKDEERSSVSRITFFSMRDDKLYRVTQNSSAKGNTEINSHVLATSIPNISISNLDEPINISFNLINQNANKPQCVYWDESSGLDPHWSLNGCNVSNYIPGKEVTCSCDRLKSFAVLMDVYQKEGEKENANYLSIVSNAGFGISFVCLVFTIIIHVCFRKLWDLMSSKILVSLCSSLAVTYFIFLVGMQSYVQTMAGCKVVAGFLHYFLLTSLACMSVEAFHVFLSVVVVFKTCETSFMKKSSILAWGLPAVIVTITLAINNTDNYTKIAEVCWLSEPSFHVAFLTPVVIILIFNFILISLVTWRLISPQRNKRFDRKRSIVRVLGLVGLLFLFGLTWVFAFFAVSEAATVFRYLFLVCNTLQGIFIFVFYCLYKKDTRDGVKEFVNKRKRANPWKFTTGKSSRCGNETENIAAETNF